MLCWIQIPYKVEGQFIPTGLDSTNLEFLMLFPKSNDIKTIIVKLLYTSLC